MKRAKPRVTDFAVQLIQNSSIPALDFEPRMPWPKAMPAIAATFSLAEGYNAPHVIAGFGRLADQGSGGASILVLDLQFDSFETALEGVGSYHGGFERLSHFEKLRLSAKLARLFKVELPQNLDWLLSFSIEFQNFCDDKNMAFRSLEPLKFIPQAWDAILVVVQTLGASHAECRDIFDLWCDLITTKKMNLEALAMGLAEGSSEAPKTAQAYITKLRTLRFPVTLSQDSQQSSNLTKVSWPKNVKASFDRNGDRGSVQLKIQLDSEKTYLQTLRKLNEIQSQNEFKKLWESSSP